MTPYPNKPIDWFEDNIIVYVDGIGELRAHYPRTQFWVCDDEAMIPYDDIAAYTSNDIVLSSVATDDYRFWIYDGNVYRRIDAHKLPSDFEDFIVFDIRRPALDFAAIYAAVPQDDDIETFLNSLL